MEYIEREALKTELQKKIELSHNARRAVIEEDFIAIIDDMPDADVVEARHGEWVYNRGQAFGEPCYFCSLCIDGGSDNGRDNYCPNCGAKMDVKDRE